MRIVAGEWRGRALAGPPGQDTRPTADRVRQALFDRLRHADWARPPLVGARVLDAFAGTGALGLEALSRGAATAVFIERDRAALSSLRSNVAACRAEARCRVVAADALRPPRGEPCDLVFLDPPYGKELLRPAFTALDVAGWVDAEALLLVEVGRSEPDPFEPEPLARFTAGAARVLAYRADTVRTAPSRPA